MNLLTFPFRLPLLPVRSLMWLATLITEEVEQERANPATIRRELEHAEQARASGEISDEQAAEFERAALAKFSQARRSAVPTSGREG